MARFKLISGGGDSDNPKSNGEDFQCDCPQPWCSCTDWGPWVPAGKLVPRVVLCNDCKRGQHKD